ncbi:MAG TPA: DUF4175 family protein [Gemmatimonadales bacterium]|nr:DUF4175 family protein [Gemmatimonadales bacterium]
MTRTGAALAALTRGFRQLSLAGWVASAGAALALTLGIGAWGARLGWFGQPWWVLIAWASAALVALVPGALGIRELRRLSPTWLAGQLESAGFRPGALRGHLEAAAAGTSEALRAAADQYQATELANRGPAILERIQAPFRRGAVRGLAALALGTAVLASARPTHGRAALLWRPVEAWSSTVAPLTLSLDRNVVDRGDRVAVRVAAPGREHAILWTRAPGEEWRGQGLSLDSAGRTTTALGPLESDLFVRMTSGGRSSDTLEVRVRLPAFLGTLAVTARYPKYLGLGDEPVPTRGDTVAVPEGTRFETRGEATAALSSAAWSSGGVQSSLAVDGPRFHGDLVPTGVRIWELRLSTAEGRPLSGDTVRIPVVTVADSAPRVDVPVPGADTVVPLTLRVPLVVDAQDDHGLTRIAIVSRRISQLGLVDPVRSEDVTLPAGASDHAILPFELNLKQRGLLPGDSVRFYAEATDNAPAAHVARSKEYVLRLPTLSEVREAARQTGLAVGRQLDSITQGSRQLERRTEDLARERPRNGQNTTNNADGSMGFENAKRAEAVVESQQALIKQAEQVKEALEALARSAEAAGLNDPEWQARLKEIQDQLDRALTPELRQRLEELQQALKDLDPERAQEALQRLAEAQRLLREALERSAELFKRAALEGDMANLAAEAKDLAQRQQQWTAQVPQADSTGAPREEQALAARADSLGAGLTRVSSELASDSGRQVAIQQAASQAHQAAGQMRQAAQSAGQGDRSAAAQEGKEASQQLDPLGDQIQSQRSSMQQEWRNEVRQALDRALGDASRLAERQLQVADALKRGNLSAETRAEQGALEEGVRRLLDQVKDIGGKNALVSDQSRVTLSASRDNMRQALDALSNATPNGGEATRRAEDAVDALNATAYTLMRSRAAVEGSQSGSGLQEAMEQMAQMAQQQGQIGQQAGGLLPQMGQGAGLIQQQLRALAAQQRALSEQLERMRAGGQIPGAADMAGEAKDLARTMEAGRLDRQTVERQERLFRRMLDAGRTLQGQEQDQNQRRTSTPATDDSVHLPPALQLRESDPALRMPSWDELQQLSPEDRRRAVEYFRRLSETVKAAP